MGWGWLTVARGVGPLGDSLPRLLGLPGAGLFTARLFARGPGVVSMEA